MLQILLGSYLIATTHWFVPYFTTDVPLLRRKGRSHLISFYFLNAFIDSFVSLAESLPVFITSKLLVSILEMEKIFSSFIEVFSSFIEVVLKCREID